jgi:glyceraldehyde 3-phosphate dehydrogenase
VPAISVSTIDATIRLRAAPDGDFNDFLRESFAKSPLVGMTDDPCVSTDLRGRPESVVLALPETMRIGADQVRIMGWYDNEWGFSARMIDMTRRIAARRG